MSAMNEREFVLDVGERIGRPVQAGLPNKFLTQVLCWNMQLVTTKNWCCDCCCPRTRSTEWRNEKLCYPAPSAKAKKRRAKKNGKRSWNRNWAGCRKSLWSECWPFVIAAQLTEAKSQKIVAEWRPELQVATSNSICFARAHVCEEKCLCWVMLLLDKSIKTLIWAWGCAAESLGSSTRIRISDTDLINWATVVSSLATGIEI